MIYAASRALNEVSKGVHMFRKISFVAGLFAVVASVGYAGSLLSIPQFFASYFGKTPLPKYSVSDEQIFSAIVSSNPDRPYIEYSGSQVSRVTICGDTRAAIRIAADLCQMCDAQRCCTFSPENISCTTVVYQDNCEKVSCEQVQ